MSAYSDIVAAAMTEPTATFKNTNLAAARSAKNDEFYTQWADIEREMNAYLEYDPDVFRDKVDPAAVRRPGVEQLHQVLRPALRGLRPQEADLDVLRARQQPGGSSTTSRPCSRPRDPQFDADQDARQRQEVRARSRRTSTATASSTSTTSSGSTSTATATSAAPR